MRITHQTAGGFLAAELIDGIGSVWKPMHIDGSVKNADVPGHSINPGLGVFGGALSPEENSAQPYKGARYSQYSIMCMRQKVKLIHKKYYESTDSEDFLTHISQGVEKYLGVLGALLIVR